MTATVADYAELNGVRTYYEIHGEGPPLLLLHGGLCPVETMAGLIRLLAERYRVYFPERRAHGRTADVAGPITYDIMAQDTIAFMGAVGLSEADVVGWSDGATVGLLVALRRPDLVKRLVHIGQQLNPEGLHPQGREMLKRESMPTEGLPPMLKDLYAAVSPDGPEHWDAVVDKLWRLYRTEPNLPLSELAHVRAPTLVVIAEHDFPTPEHGEAMRRALPDGRLEVVAGGTHGLPMEQPEILARLVLDFLDDPTQAARSADTTP
jgi:pimeloyl-ACP methyl ester carboxylesterase